MSDHAAFIRAICEEPDNDLPRLIYADFLDENGEGERAEFIRVQFELAANEKQCSCHITAPSHCYGCQLRRREHLLLMHHFAYLKFGDLTLTSTDNPNPTGQPTMVYRRGFLHTIRASAAEWQRLIGPEIQHYDWPETIGQQILRQHPVERVEFTDCGRRLYIQPPSSKSIEATDNGVIRFIASPTHWQLAMSPTDILSRPPATAVTMTEFATRTALIDAMPQQLRAWGVGGMPDIQRLPPGRILTARRVVRDIRQTPIPLDVSTRIS